MKKWNCMIVDDEPVAIRIIKQHLGKIKKYEIVKSSTGVMEALEFLKDNSVDLLFLDIEMPDLTGIQLFKTLKDPPALILITAHRDYAVEGFEINAIDYLLKPVSFPRFVQALNRFEQSRAPKKYQVSHVEESKGFIFVTVDRKKKKLNLDDIIYVESLKDYIRIFTERDKIITKETTTDFEQRLPSDSFLRIHRSFIVNVNKIETVSYDEITAARRTLPVGRSYKEGVMEKLGIN